MSNTAGLRDDGPEGETRLHEGDRSTQVIHILKLGDL